MHARSALFDLYGDHLSARGYWAPIAGIVRMLGAVDVAPPAVRTAVSRMVREGWLAPQEVNGVRGYVASARAQARLGQAHVRVYRTADPPWNGCWHLVVVDRAADRAQRARVGAAMEFLGYGRLAADTWAAPRAGAGLDDALLVEGVGYRSFESRFAGSGTDLAASLWDLGGLGTAYRGFVDQVRELGRDLPGGLDGAGSFGALSPRSAFALRSKVVHEWRKFLFRDPGLPAEVLPPRWPGHEAATVFSDVSTSLMPRASAFVEACMMAEAKPGPVAPGPR